MKYEKALYKTGENAWMGCVLCFEVVKGMLLHAESNAFRRQKDNFRIPKPCLLWSEKVCFRVVLTVFLL
ncbi:MAG: hypothetical protein SO013_06325 [Prevotella sp.]|nr:hypothetical protein [Prevotella sp.]